MEGISFGYEKEMGLRRTPVATRSGELEHRTRSPGNFERTGRGQKS